MQKILSSKDLEKLTNVTKVIPTTDVLDFFNKLTEAYKEYELSKRETACIEAKKEIVLTQIQKKYELYYFAFNTIFEERRDSIHKMFEMIDRGMRENDKELISMGLQNLSKIVSSSPFASLNQLSSILEEGKIIEV